MVLSVDEIKALVEQPKQISVSIYMPTETAGRETRQNSIRFKNLMKQAEAQLDQHELRHTNSVEFLQAAHKLDTDEFWQHQDAGLAVFMADNFFHYYRLPLHFEELVVVESDFHLKPLLPLLTGDGLFYVLALSQEQVRLLACTQHNVSEIRLENVPQSLDDALQRDIPDEEIQFRINTSRGGTNNPFTQSGSYHGVGSPDTDRDRLYILEFCRAVDRALQDILHGQQAPMVLAAVEYLMPIYRQANNYPNLLEAGVTGNAEILKPEELRDRAWEVVEPYFMETQKAAIAQYHDLVGSGRTSTELEEAVAAAHYGRVDRLFVANGEPHWGKFNPDSNQVELHSDMEPGDQDLLNLAAIQTILNGGTVYAVEPDQVPEDAPLAAVFRY